MSVVYVASCGVAWFFSWLFSRAAIHKLGSPGYYRNLLPEYLPRLPSGIVSPIVSIIGVLEFSLAVMLLVPVFRDLALFGSTVLLLEYSGLMYAKLGTENNRLKCGCAGPGSTLSISRGLVARNLSCAGLAILVLVLPKSVGSQTVFEMQLSFCVASFLVVSYLIIERLAANTQFNSILERSQ